MDLYGEEGKKIRKKDKNVYYYSPSDQNTLKKVPGMFDETEDVKKFVKVCLKISYPSITDNQLDDMWYEAFKNNQIILQAIEELKKENETSGNVWKSRAYAKAFKSLKMLKIPIVSGSQVMKIQGIGKGIASHIDDIIKNGRLKSQEERTQESMERQIVLEKFLEIWGVGPKIANSWYQKGHRDISDLVAEKLNDQQKVGIKYAEEFKQKIPRHEAQKIFSIINKKVLKKYPKAKIEMVGSYRRGAEELGDIDIIMSLFPEQSKLELQEIINDLTEDGIVTDVPVLGEEKFMGVCVLPSSDIHRRIDIRLVEPSQWGAALLHSTGSSTFNIQIRQQASQLGYKLNEKGLFKMSVLDDGDELIQTYTEKQIFEELGIPYVPPEQRV